MKFLKIKKSNYSGWGIYLSSGCDEYPGCKINIRIPGYWIALKIPPIIRPIKRWVDLSKNVGKPGYDWLKPNKNGTYGYHEIIEREYSISYGETYLHVRYGQQTNDSTDTKSWCKEIPWLAWRFVRHSLYNLDGSHFADEPQGNFRDTYDEGQRLKAAQPKAYFRFKDYDGEEIKVRCRIEEREWQRGRGWFTWLSWFYAPKIDRTLDLWFSSEVGRKKGSWKGGTLGHAISMFPAETPKAAFRRYCIKQQLTYLGPTDPWADKVFKEEPAAKENKP